MDVFALREKVVSDYKQYIESFIRIRDERIDVFVQEELKKGALWPEAILQVNSTYQLGPRLDKVTGKVQEKKLHGEYRTRRLVLEAFDKLAVSRSVEPGSGVGGRAENSAS